MDASEGGGLMRRSVPARPEKTTANAATRPRSSFGWIPLKTGGLLRLILTDGIGVVIEALVMVQVNTI